jgi:ribosomal subunit interface protein
MMQIRVSGKNIDIGEALPERVRTELSVAVGKYFDRDAEANVVFSKEKIGFAADCTMHLSAGTTMHAHGDGPDAYRAFEVALEHLEKQVRRHMRRLKNHHERKGPERSAAFE